MLRSFAAWTSQASHLLGDCFDEAKPILDQAYEGLPPLTRFVAAQLFTDCHLSSESVLLLVRAGKEWDADLICRSIMEGSLKFAYMLQGSPEELQEKATEYWHVLPLFAVIRHGEHAKHFLEDVPDPAAPEWLPFHDLLVEDAEVTSIRSKYSRRDRQILEGKWSFSGLCKAFSASGNPALRGLAALAHGYSMSSHLLHKDADGVGMVWERARRSPERQRAAAVGHSARVVSDVCSFAKLRLISLLRACGKPEKLISGLDLRYESLHLALKAANEEFNRVEYGVGA